jgi:molybdate transport system permease protein
MVLDPAETEALMLSIRVAGVAVLGSLPFAVACGYVLARTEFPGKLLLDGLVHLPVVMPPVVAGYLLLVTFGARAPIGAWLQEWFGIRLVFSWTGAALASAVMTFPFQVRAIRQALENIDGNLEGVARSLGASSVDVFLSVTLPLMLPGVTSGIISAFTTSLGQFGAIITFVSNIPGETRTLPLAIYTALQTPGGDAAAARLAAISLMLAFAGLILSEQIGKRLRRIVRG